MKDRLIPFIGSILLHLGLISGLLLFGRSSSSLQIRPKVIPIRLIEIKEDIIPIKASLKKSVYPANEISFSKTIFPEKLIFSERNFKNDHKEKINLLQEAGAMDSENVPLPDPSDVLLKEDTVFSEEKAGRLKNFFLAKIRERIERVKRYPRGAQLNGIEGKAIVKFNLSANGEANSISLVSSSKHTILDNEAKRTVERASPFPPIPEGLKKKEIEITVPITFRLKD